MTMPKKILILTTVKFDTVTSSTYHKWPLVLTISQTEISITGESLLLFDTVYCNTNFNIFRIHLVAQYQRYLIPQKALDLVCWVPRWKRIGTDVTSGVRAPVMRSHRGVPPAKLPCTTWPWALLWIPTPSLQDPPYAARDWLPSLCATNDLSLSRAWRLY